MIRIPFFSGITATSSPSFRLYFLTSSLGILNPKLSPILTISPDTSLRPHQSLKYFMPKDVYFRDFKKEDSLDIKG